MAATDFGSLTAAQKKVWSIRLWKAGRVNSMLMSSNMIGTEAMKPIQLITELKKDEKGDKCVMQLVQDLQGDGVVDDNKLEGNEEAMANEAITLTLSQLRHGTRNTGRMSDQKTVINFRSLARDKLGYWFADKLDELAFLVMSGVSFTLKLDGSNRSGASQLPLLAFAADVTAPSTNRRYFCGDATATNNMTDDDTIRWNDIVRARVRAERSRVKPLKMGGKPYYICLLSPECAGDLKTDPDYKAALSQAGTRGKGNGMFTGEFADIDGVLLYSADKVKTTLGAASGAKYGATGTVDGAQNLLLGAQAMGYARIGDPSWDESDHTDYGNSAGLGHGQIIGMLKPKFISYPDGGSAEDFGVYSIYAAASRP